MHSISQTLSGRGDKDVQEISEILPGKWADKLDWRKLTLFFPPTHSARRTDPSFLCNADVDSNANSVQT